LIAPIPPMSPATILWSPWWSECSPFTSSSGRPAPPWRDRPPAADRGHRQADRRPGLWALWADGGWKKDSWRQHEV